MTRRQPKYDVALSFAGEDREYVSKVAALLQSNNIAVFYDEYKQVELWGKDLYQHLSTVYRDESRYCVIFVSEAYAAKVWPRHELRNAQARAFREHHEYILPARFDDTELPGVLPTTGYVDLRSRTPPQLAALIIAKLASAASESGGFPSISTSDNDPQKAAGRGREHGDSSMAVTVAVIEQLSATEVIVPCARCKQSGRKYPTESDSAPCWVCRGRGTLLLQIDRLPLVECRRCVGSGRKYPTEVDSLECQSCHGAGCQPVSGEMVIQN